MRPYLLIAGFGAVLVAIAAGLGGGAAAIGGLAALKAQLAAVALLRPAMRGPNPTFLARWLGGMAIRVLALGLVIGYAATHRRELPLLAASLGYLGVLLPLLFTETRFVR